MRTAASADASSTPAPRVPIEALAWLAGHWRNRDAEEVWLAPRGGLMLAISREVRGGAAAGGPGDTAKPPRVSFEYLRIEQRTDGSLVLLASPAGRPPTPFALAGVDARRVRFRNESHDFPQEILYWREGDTLRAHISGVVNGQRQALAYAWAREPDAGATSPVQTSAAAPAPAPAPQSASPPSTRP